MPALLPKPQLQRSQTLLLDLLMQRVALEEGIVFLLLDALGDGFLVARGEVAGGGLPLLLGLGAFQGDEFLHGVKMGERSAHSRAGCGAIPKCRQLSGRSGGEKIGPVARPARKAEAEAGPR